MEKQFSAPSSCAAFTAVFGDAQLCRFLLCSDGRRFVVTACDNKDAPLNIFGIFPSEVQAKQFMNEIADEYVAGVRHAA